MKSLLSYHEEDLPLNSLVHLKQLGLSYMSEKKGCRLESNVKWITTLKKGARSLTFQINVGEL